MTACVVSHGTSAALAIAGHTTNFGGEGASAGAAADLLGASAGSVNRGFE